MLTPEQVHRIRTEGKTDAYFADLYRCRTLSAR